MQRGRRLQVFHWGCVAGGRGMLQPQIGPPCATHTKTHLADDTPGGPDLLRSMRLSERRLLEGLVPPARVKLRSYCIRRCQHVCVSTPDIPSVARDSFLFCSSLSCCTPRSMWTLTFRFPKPHVLAVVFHTKPSLQAYSR